VTLQGTADSINALFHQYGLDHDVVEAYEPHQALVLVGNDDPAAMELLHTTLEHVFTVYFTVHPPSEQLRLF
jgi:hypothetical protein